MKALWAIWPSLLDDDSCDSIIKQAMFVPEQTATITEQRIVDHDMRESTVRFIQPEMPGFEALFKFIQFRFAWVNRDFFGVDSHFIGNVQFTTYHEARRAHYNWHTDVDWTSQQPYQRKLSMVIQLSDAKSYEGGTLELDTSFRLPDVARERGTMICFPAFVQHRVMPVTAGVRHSLVAWQEGPHWR